MSQTFLTENPPMILDATCSFARIWPAHATLRMDIRKEVKPDIVADARFLPFREGTFDTIFCDPPHLITGPGQGIREARRRTGRTSFDMFTRYHWWDTRKDWLDFVDKSGPEFKRTLKDNGQLRYKITVCRGMKLDDLKPMPFEIAQDKKTKSRSNLYKNYCHWLIMKPLPKSITTPARILEIDAQSL